MVTKETCVDSKMNEVDIQIPCFDIGIDAVLQEIMEVPTQELLTEPMQTEEKEIINKRFKKTTEAERDDILTGCDSQATKKSTKYTVSTFKSWLIANGQSEDFEMLPFDVINKQLEVYYTEIKSVKGHALSKSSFVGIRSGINRHINSPPFKRNTTIMQAPEFSTSNKMFISVLKKSKQEGNDRTHHYPPIATLDLEKIRDPFAFDWDIPTELQQKVFFETQYYFARRGRENLRELKKTSFDFKRDDKGKEFCEISFNEKTKNHQVMKGPQTKPRMYETGEEDCPIQSLKLYLSKLDPNEDTFYVKPITRKHFNPKHEEIWFTKSVLGVNTIGSLMKQISKRLKLSQDYTNHSIRATVVTLLTASGFEARKIMNVTGHKCESSLRSYDGDNSDEQKRQISAVMSGRQDQKLTRIEPQIIPNSATATTSREQLQDKLVVSSNVNCTINFNF